MLKKTAAGSVCAGLFIGIGGAAFLACPNIYIGAVFFCVALLSICLLSCRLYTGRIGTVVECHSGADIASLAVCLFGNFAGTGLCALMVWLSRRGYSATAREMCLSKLEKTPEAVFFAAVLCGILMYTAVTVYRVRSSVVGILFCVPVFIICGFEHSIADMFYFWISGVWTPKAVLFLLLVVAGNSVGGCIVPILKKISGEKI